MKDVNHFGQKNMMMSIGLPVSVFMTIQMAPLRRSTRCIVHSFWMLQCVVTSLPENVFMSICMVFVALMPLMIFMACTPFAALFAFVPFMIYHIRAFMPRGLHAFMAVAAFIFSMALLGFIPLMALMVSIARRPVTPGTLRGINAERVVTCVT